MKVTCKICGKKFKAITNTHLQKHNMTLALYIEKYDKNIRPEELKKKMYKKHSVTMKRNRLNGTIITPPQSEKNRRMSSERMRKNNPMKNPESLAKSIETRKGNGFINPLWKTEEHRKAVSKRMIENNPMKNPEVVKKNWIAHKNKKSGFELKFEQRTKGLPIEFVWDWSYWIAHKNPDYLVLNTKTVIEVTSTAYYRVENGYEGKRIKLFEKHWHRCITMRIESCRKDYRELLKKNIFNLFKKIINEDKSYQVTHSKEGKVHCLQYEEQEKS